MRSWNFNYSLSLYISRPRVSLQVLYSPVCVRVCVYVCVREWGVGGCVRACVRTFLHVCACVRACTCPRVYALACIYRPIFFACALLQDIKLGKGVNETFHGVNRTGKIAFIARLPIALTLSPITLACWKSVSEGTLSLRALLLYLHTLSLSLPHPSISRPSWKMIVHLRFVCVTRLSVRFSCLKTC